MISYLKFKKLLVIVEIIASLTVVVNWSFL